MDLIGKVSAAVGWAWNWLVWLWAKARSFGNQVIDPPPQRMKWYIGVVLAIAVGGMWFGGAVVSWFDRHVLWPLHEAAAPVVEPVTLLPRNALIPSAMPEKLADAPKPMPPAVAPPKAPAGPVAAPAPVPAKAVKPVARKRKQEAASSPFPY